MLKPLALAALLCAAPVFAQEAGPASEPPMTLERLSEIITTLDPDAQSAQTSFQMTIADIPVIIITDPRADRMRAMVPIRSAEAMTEEELLRVMQANFDTALDARYAIARGQLWATFIHPLSPLERDQLISGLGQAVNLAQTYGSLYTGGAMQFGGGDSGGLQRELIDRLLKKGQEI
ncbi:hypothetical protein C8N43_1924 [Litoreibacter ponti]|uniref:Uncharacterized protein n=1 Tax=Litoreibacter ponti TaxID=1510457 RepID=A0A2T6BMF1_9RHOB|nr:hypothetical protein [Litoreibacter ponti]PTX57258.1 hypothetical protein C8N43_1924 [Litoreibacter ponti]